MNIKKQLKYYDAEINFIPRITDDENPCLFEFVDFCYWAGLEAGFTKEQLNNYFTKEISKYYDDTTREQKIASDILNFIKTYAYSKESKYVNFRVDNGSKGVINAIIQYIEDCYL